MTKKTTKVPKLPPLIEQKLTKAGYTRGASTREIYQNRVARSNTVLIDYEFWEQCRPVGQVQGGYENGFIVLVRPDWYFSQEAPDSALAAEGLTLGRNALLIFQRRSEWIAYGQRDSLPNGMRFEAATSRTDPLGGVFIARVHGTVNADAEEIRLGFNDKKTRGAGIRVYEYASSETIREARIQLEALIWMCVDSLHVMSGSGMSGQDALLRKAATMAEAEKMGLLDLGRLVELRVINSAHHPVCPLCLKPISALDFFRRTEQAAGRAVHDLTTTEVSLFHIQELRVGALQHRPYNLGWGHHFCNVVVKDAGIMPTLLWMRDVIDGQGDHADLEMERVSVEQAAEGAE